MDDGKPGQRSRYERRKNNFKHGQWRGGMGCLGLLNLVGSAPVSTDSMDLSPSPASFYIGRLEAFCCT